MLDASRHFISSNIDILLMAKILHQLIGSLSYYLQGLIYIPGCAWFLPSTVSLAEYTWEPFVGFVVNPLKGSLFQPKQKNKGVLWAPGMTIYYSIVQSYHMYIPIYKLNSKHTCHIHQKYPNMWNDTIDTWISHCFHRELLLNQPCSFILA